MEECTLRFTGKRGRHLFHLMAGCRFDASVGKNEGYAKSFVMIFRRRQVPEIIHQGYHIGAGFSDVVMLVGFFAGVLLDLLSPNLVKHGVKRRVHRVSCIGKGKQWILQSSVQWPAC